MSLSSLLDFVGPKLSRPKKRRRVGDVQTTRFKRRSLLESLEDRRLLAVIYDADFSTDGAGFADHSTTAPPAAAPASTGPLGSAPNQWALSYDTLPATDSGGNEFKVEASTQGLNSAGSGLVLQSADWGGQGIFESQAIDVSSLSTASISAVALGEGGDFLNSSAEFFTWFYELDGVRTDSLTFVDPVDSTLDTGADLGWSLPSLDVSSANSLVVGFEFNINGGGDGFEVGSITVDDDAPPTGTEISIAATDALKPEGDSGTTPFTFTVTRTGLTNAAGSVSYSVTNTDTNAADFSGSTSGTVNFLASETSQVVTIDVAGDTDAESSEDFEVVLSAPTAGATLGTAAATGTIIDDDTPLPNVVINEFVANHTGVDTDEFIELFTLPNADLSALTVLVIDGDGGASGTINQAFPLGVADGAGYFTVFQTNILQNGSQTYALVSGFTGAVGDDLDTDNTGGLDSTPWIAVIDDVAVSDGGTADQFYSTAVITPGQDGNTFSYGGASRNPNGADSDTAGDWLRNDFNGDGLPSFGLTFTTQAGQAVNTPGSINVVNNASPALFVDQTGGVTQVSESGVTDTFVVRLATGPSSDVDVTLTPDAQVDLGAGAGLPITITLDSALGQEVTVTAVDDTVTEGPHTSLISISAASTDSDYNGLTSSVTASISDNETAAPLTVINEFVANHTGQDADGFVEVLSAPNADLGSLSILEIDGDGTTIGTVDSITALGVTNSAGFFTALTDFNNGGINLLLVEGFMGAVGDDLDIDDNGEFDFDEVGASVSAPWITVRDGVATLGGGDTAYTDAVLVAGFDGGGFQPGGASRIPDGTDTDTDADWVRNAFNGAGLPSFAANVADPGEAVSTPNLPNVVQSGLVLIESGGATTVFEAGAGDDFTVALGTVPSATVTLTLTPDSELDLGAGQGTAITVNFLADASATTPVIINVDAFDDTIEEGPHLGLISFSFSGGDPSYSGTAGDLTVTVRDDDLITPEVVISEIMYNPDSAEPGGGPVGEWIEIVNIGPGAADIGGWMFDDEDGDIWDPIPAGTTLSEGQVAVVYDSGFTDAATFRTQWGVPASSLVIGIGWGNLSNGPSGTNEVLELLDSSMFQQDLVNYDDEGDWPGDPGGPSIYLTNIATDNNVGTNWALSDLGVDDAINPTGPTYNTTDIGSPGVVPAIVSSLNVTETDGGTIVTEGGATDTIELLLTGVVTADVDVTLTPSNSEIDLGNGAGAPLTVTLTSAGTVTTVTVTAFDDSIIDGTLTSDITFTTSSTDAAFNGLVADPVTVTVNDNDAPSSSVAVINEFVANHPSTDDDAFVEFFFAGATGPTDLSSLTLLEIEGDFSATAGFGTIDRATTLGTTDANGYYVSDVDAENGTLTFLLVTGFTGSVGNDLDTDDDGTVDLATLPWTTIVDSVAVINDPTEDAAYFGATELLPTTDGGTLPYGGASRIPNGTDTDTTADWVRNDFSGAGLPSFPGVIADPGEAINTPGLPNEVAVGSGDTTPPTITDVIVAGVDGFGAWTTDFIDAVDDSGPSGADNGLGFSVTGVTRTIPWYNVDTFYIRYSEDVNTPTGLSLLGLDVADYAGLFTVSHAGDLTTVSMTSAFGLVETDFGPATTGIDRLVLGINAGGVTDLAGNSIADAFSQSINVLPGDGTGEGSVLNNDVGLTNFRSFLNTNSNPGPNSFGFSYDPFFDVTSNGQILNDDVGLTNFQSFDELPELPEPMSFALRSEESISSVNNAKESWDQLVDQAFEKGLF
ncbi:hypothetical protein LF1_33510 [Rubripirellula obstinata]|uniref:LTD domain-containing protein n=1 Tax=Rubripirellula obstinata TaxID=406547 RepID=A0A5B1CLZ3_9BACT|nr:lamin tail domain-containing protein [Rubripirellula obstinata]KAA1260809.1 hypothetical protein LF1_33510 [Rubripirellula obstinata]